MTSLLDYLAQHLVPLLFLVALALLLTFVVFRRRMFERGYRKGEPKDPQQVKRENPPDAWSRDR